MAKGNYEVEMVESVYNALAEVVASIGDDSKTPAPDMGTWTSEEVNDHLLELELSTGGTLAARKNRITGWYNEQPTVHEKALLVAALVIGDGDPRISLAEAKAQVG